MRPAALGVGGCGGAVPWLLKYNLYEIMHRKERKAKLIKSFAISAHFAVKLKENKPSIRVNQCESVSYDNDSSSSLFLYSPTARHLRSPRHPR